MLFKGKNIYKNKSLLPYSIKDLDNYLHESKFKYNWKGVSFQVREGFFQFLTELEIEKYEKLFKNILDNFESSNKWYIQPEHSFKLFPWLIQKDDLTLKKLGEYLVDGYSFKGFIAVEQQDVLFFFRELLLYSKVTKAQDLMLFNEKAPFIVKFSQHLCLDIISTENKLINQIVEDSSDLGFIVKKYQE